MPTTRIEPMDTIQANMLRQACLRPEAAHLYPHLSPGQWVPAAEIAARLLGEAARGKVESGHPRILSDEHFEFRGGGREATLRYRARTRWTDRPRLSALTVPYTRPLESSNRAR